MIRSFAILESFNHMICNFTRSNVDLFLDKPPRLHFEDHISEKIDNNPLESYKKLSNKVEDRIVENMENRIVVFISIEKT